MARLTKLETLLSDARNSLNAMKNKHIYALNRNLNPLPDSIAAFYNFNEEHINLWKQVEEHFNPIPRSSYFGSATSDVTYGLSGVDHDAIRGTGAQVYIQIKASALPAKPQPILEEFKSGLVSPEFPELARGTTYAIIDALTMYKIADVYLTRASHLPLTNLSYSLPFIHELLFKGELKRQHLPKSGLFFTAASRELGMSIRTFLLGAKILTEDINVTMALETTIGFNKLRTTFPDPFNATETIKAHITI